MEEPVMLVLSRKIGECVVIGDNVTVRVLEVRGNKIRVGIEAPAETKVLREELCQEWHPRPFCGEPKATVRVQ
jgi:carbon storage regulator CsrA